VRGATLRLAHRGDWRRAPENTIPALLAGLRVPGCDGLEFDVRRSRDGVPVLLHDATLARVQGVDARVDALSSTELARHGVPTLAKALAAIPRTAFLDVELKEDPPTDAVVEVLEAARGSELRNAVVSSFEPWTLETVGRLRPSWPRWLNVPELSEAAVAAAHDLGCRGISAGWRSITARSLELARRADLEVAAWTVRRRPTFERLAGLGVTAVCVEAAALDG
jgi:glycerophosphoryl diester phosphodiesterase